MGQVGRPMTWEKCMKALTSGLARVSALSFPGYGPRDPPKRGLETVADVAQCCSQYNSCNRNLFPFSGCSNLIFAADRPLFLVLFSSCEQTVHVDAQFVIVKNKTETEIKRKR